MIDIKELYQYYINSLEFLNTKARSFAKQYPKVASSLQITDSGSNDPDVRRLLETFAMFDAKTSYTINQEKDTLINFLTNIICPQILCPYPSVMIVQFLNNTRDVQIPKHSQIVITNKNNIECKFRTIQEVELTKTEVLGISSARNLPGFDGYALIIKLAIKESKIRFYINTDHEVAGQILLSITSRFPDENPPIFDATTMKKIGTFHLNNYSDSILDMNPTNDIYSIVQDYSSTPHIFQFFDLNILPEYINQTLEIAIMLDSNLPSHALHDKLLLTNCAAVANLFYHKSEPTKYSLFKDESELFGNVANFSDKIHYLSKLFNYNPSNGKEILYERNAGEYFTLSSHDFTKMRIFFRDRTNIEHDTLLYGTLLCSNGEEGENISFSSSFHLEEMNYISGITITNPTLCKQNIVCDKWFLLSLFNSNKFEEACMLNTLLEFIDEVNKMYNINYTKDAFLDIKYIEDLGITSSSDTWNTIVTKSIFKVMIDQNIKNSIMLAIVWGELIISLNRLDRITEVHIYGKNSNLIKILYDD